MEKQQDKQLQKQMGQLQKLKLGQCLQQIRLENPLIHNITNYVTAEACANMLLACGASPMMAEEYQEMGEIATRCKGLTLNLGTLRRSVIPSMIHAGQCNNYLNHPVILDPVGVGATTFRTTVAKQLIERVQMTVIRGNISEIKALAGCGKGLGTKGVDASLEDRITMQSLDYVMEFAKKFARKTNVVLVITGEMDLVTDGSLVYLIKNGHPLMGQVTGTGCQLSALLTACVAANPKKILEAVVAGVCAMGLCGELAYQRKSARDGTATYGRYMIDAMSNLTAETLEQGAKYELL